MQINYASQSKLSALMGFNSQTLKQFFAFLLILFATLLVSSSCPASCNQILPKIRTDPNANHPVPAYQVLPVKNTAPFLNKPEFDKKRKRKKMKRRKIKNNFRTRPFSAMLPKGFVPPSGSSPCHNDKPESSVAHALFCGLSTTSAKP